MQYRSRSHRAISRLPDDADEHIDPGNRMGDSPVMLRCAQYLAAHRDRPFAALRVSAEGSISSSVVFFETASLFWNDYTSSQFPLDSV